MEINAMKANNKKPIISSYHSHTPLYTFYCYTTIQLIKYKDRFTEQ